ncbi:MAG: tetratricopeptide repeat protein [Phycisphaerales bacterium]|nr:tetratricopeptide repeat protein [Phycisphaerales bacterium]
MTFARCTRLVALLLGMAVSGGVSAQQNQLVPDGFDLIEPARKALEADWLTDAERSELRVRHGVWNEEDLVDPQRAAEAALSIWRLDDPSLSDSGVPALLRAEGLLRRGHFEEAILLVEPLDSRRAKLLRAVALERLGRFDEADAAVDGVLEGLDARQTDDPDDLVDAVEAMSIRGRVEGRPSRDYQAMMKLLGRARNDLDRLDWRSRLLEARLLVEKHNKAEAIPALYEVLGLNPRCAEAWYLLGRIGLGGFDFDSATRAIAALQRLDEENPLASLLQAESALINDDPDLAIFILDQLLEREGAMREALALRAAADAVAYDLDGAKARLAEMDLDAPGAADGWYEVGRFLAKNRQYGDAAEILEEAVRRRENYSAPLIELGLLEMQSGRDDRALDVLRKVAEVDRFNERATFSLRLLEELAGFQSLESDHFVIRYRPGEDEVVARMMPEALDQMHREVSARFGHEPARRTVIEVMPNHQFFSVRITGMPWIHTIAACTGPVIAIEVPREGARTDHLGLFDWLEVLRHEYTHTITLDRTRNRIPHWLTEAASVSMETRPRDYQTQKMLATALRAGELFDLNEINWAFVRPQKPTDRSMAYAQGAWMVEFMDEVWGEQALVELLDHYFDGRPESDAMPAVLGISREAFHDRFLDWARDRVGEWGLFPTPSIEALQMSVIEQDPKFAASLEEARLSRVRGVASRLAGRIGSPAGPGSAEPVQWPTLTPPRVPLDADQVDVWLEVHEEHPDLLEYVVRKAIDRDQRTDPEAIELLQRYRRARPGDPYPDRVLARILLDSDRPERAVPSLSRLDLLSEKDASYAWELARIHRSTGDGKEALSSATRMVRIDPYRAGFRELAAAIAIEQRDFTEALQHVRALILLEPEREIHQRRLEAINGLIKRSESELPD